MSLWILFYIIFLFVYSNSLQLYNCFRITSWLLQHVLNFQWSACPLSPSKSALGSLTGLLHCSNCELQYLVGLFIATSIPRDQCIRNNKMGSLHFHSWKLQSWTVLTPNNLLKSQLGFMVFLQEWSTAKKKTRLSPLKFEASTSNDRYVNLPINSTVIGTALFRIKHL